jgi:hypothetical protein
MNSSSSISIRTARQDDYVALWSVATLDSKLVPDAPMLVAEADGEIVAAVSLANGEWIADPFQPTSATLDLLRLRADQFPRDRNRSRSLLRRLRGRPAPLATA